MPIREQVDSSEVAVTVVGLEHELSKIPKDHLVEFVDAPTLPGTWRFNGSEGGVVVLKRGGRDAQDGPTLTYRIPLSRLILLESSHDGAPEHTFYKFYVAR